jgi:TolB-like protein/tetratricopeptide (TPR) repeat protein
MSQQTSGYQRLFADLKRRAVFKVAAVYGAVSFVVLQVADLIFPALDLPEWTLTFFVAVAALGFPIALVLAWAFETTPEGVRRTDPAAKGELEAIVAQPVSRRWPSGLLALAGIVLLYGGGWWVIGRTGGPSTVAREASESSAAGRDAPPAVIEAAVTEATPVDRRTVAVLPFESMSQDEESVLFTSGIHDDILTQLYKIRALHVTSRTTVLQYAGTDKSIPEIAGELKVAHILEGAVRRSGDRIRINVQLIDAGTDDHLWAETYDRELTAENVFAIQSEIALSVARALEAELTTEEERDLRDVPTRSMAALDAYHRGRVTFAASTDAEDRASVAYFERAVELDPDFAMAWVGLLRGRTWLIRTGFETDTGPARTSLDRALALAPNSAEARLAAGYYHYYALGDYEGALKEFTAADSLLPDRIETVEALGYIHRRLGHWKETLALGQRALELDPRDANLLWNQGLTAWALGRFEDADRLLEQSLRIHIEATVVNGWRFKALLWMDGDTTAAREFVGLAYPLVDPEMRALWGADLALAARDYPAAVRALESAADMEPLEWLRFPAAARGPLYYEDRLLYLSLVHRYAGEEDRSIAYADSLLAVAERELPARPPAVRFDVFGRRAVVHTAMAYAHALRGEKRPALREIGRALELFNADYDAIDGPGIEEAYARILVLVGEPEQALTQLEHLATIPSYLVPGRLRLDPMYDPIRDNPRFQALLERDWRRDVRD